MELLTGTDAAKQLEGKESVDAVDRVFDAFMSGGQVPAYVTDTADWPIVTVKGGGHTLEYAVIPRYWAVGTNGDALEAGKTSEFFAQKVADNYDAILPSEKMVRDIQAAASPKIAYKGIQKSDGTADDSTAAVVKLKAKVDAALSGIPMDALVIGYRKAYVVRPNLNGDYIAIYGGRWDSSGKIVQPTSGHAHTTGRIPLTPNYSDASHGIVLVSRQGTLDGEAVDMRDVFRSKDPSVVALVSSEGSFDPVFPNAGAGALGKMAYGVAEKIGGALGNDDLSTAAGRAAATRKGAGTILGTVVGITGSILARVHPVTGVIVTVTSAAFGRILGGALAKGSAT